MEFFTDAVKQTEETSIPVTNSYTYSPISRNVCHNGNLTTQLYN